MDTETSRFCAAIERIDATNAEDPNRAVFQGTEFPSELIYGRRMSDWLERLDPSASEALRLAVRCQHLRRWEIPRADYPMTRPGYYQWRIRLGAYHAELAGAILKSVGFEDAEIARVQSLIRKERIKSDAEAQTLEDVACLVFLENDYVEFAAKHPDEKVIDILRKTWRKMSDLGHQAALELAGDLPERERILIGRALGG